MPEGPEVRRYAVQLAQVLDDQKIVEISARTKAAKAWLLENPDALIGRRVTRVRAHGKNLWAQIEGGFYFYSHLMMWGRWQIDENNSDESDNDESDNRVLEREERVHEERVRDRRERARIATNTHHAILMSAPVFEIGSGDPRDIEYLRALGPDILPYEDDGVWDEHEFTRRLLSSEKSEGGAREIGAALLDQTICAGIGNYLRAEMLLLCKINPFARIAELTRHELDCLTQEIPRVASFAYQNNGATASEAQREQMRNDSALVYAPGREYGTRHLAFRRTNLPCLFCGDTIRQKRQVTRVIDDEEKSRIIYFCPTCQNVPIETKTKKSSTRKARQ